MNDASRLHRPESARVVALSLFYWTPHNIVFLPCLPKWHGKHAFANSIHESTSRTFHLGIYVHSGGLSWSKWFLEVAKSSYRRGEDFGVQDLAACQQHARTHQVGTLKPPLVLFLLTPQIHAQTCSMFFFVHSQDNQTTPKACEGGWISKSTAIIQLRKCRPQNNFENKSNICKNS